MHPATQSFQYLHRREGRLRIQLIHKTRHKKIHLNAEVLIVHTVHKINISSAIDNISSTINTAFTVNTQEVNPNDKIQGQEEGRISHGTRPLVDDTEAEGPEDNR